MFKMGAPDEAVATAKLEETRRFLRVLDTGFAGRDWLVDTLTLADFAVVSTFPLAKAAGISLADFPAVERWIERVEALPSYAKAMPAYIREVRSRG
jgi:glutathione S-transferase